MKLPKYFWGYVACFQLGLIIGAIGIYLLSWKLGFLSDPRLDWLFK